MCILICLFILFVVLLVIFSVVEVVYYGDCNVQVLVVMKVFFKFYGQVDMDCLKQDIIQVLCLLYVLVMFIGEVVFKVLVVNQVLVKFFVDGKFFGDWKCGQVIVEEGIGFQYFDDLVKFFGGNCYVCYQFDKQQIVYGMIGLLFYYYGKNCGQFEFVLKLVWSMINDMKGYLLCLVMLCFGVKGVFIEQQIKDVMVLLFDFVLLVNQ